MVSVSVIDFIDKTLSLTQIHSAVGLYSINVSEIKSGKFIKLLSPGLSSCLKTPLLPLRSFSFPHALHIYNSYFPKSQGNRGTSEEILVRTLLY